MNILEASSTGGVWKIFEFSLLLFRLDGIYWSLWHLKIREISRMWKRSDATTWGYKMFPQSHNAKFWSPIFFCILSPLPNLLSAQDPSSISQGLSSLYRDPQCQIPSDYTKENDKENITRTELHPKCRYSHQIYFFWTHNKLVNIPHHRNR